MQTSVKTSDLPATITDDRLVPDYYFDLDRADDPVIGLLLRTSETVFAVKHDLSLLFTRHRERLPTSGGFVAAGARVTGQVVVADGARVNDGAIVEGPALICPGAVVGAGSLVRDHSVIGPGCAIGFGAEITRSLLIGGIFMKHASFVGDSVVGHGANIGASVSTTGLRVDEGPVVEPSVTDIAVRLDGRRLSTGFSKFGAVIGDDVAVPAGTILQPATLIGPRSTIYPRGNQVGGFLPAGSQVR